MNIIQSLVKSATQPAHPLHAGEVFIVWTLYIAATEAAVICQLLANHTADPDLKESIEHLIADVEEPLSKKLKAFLVHEGIGIPPSTGEKPRASEALIPPGAKFTDAEIANLLVVKLEGMLNTCHFGIMQSVREDLGANLVGSYQRLVVQGFTLKKLMQQRGWFRMPPFFPLSPEEGAQH